MGRAAGYIQIYRDNPVGPIVNFRVVNIRTSGNSAGAYCNYNLGAGHSFVGFLESQFHILRYRAGNQQTVGMARRGDKLNPEPAQIEYDRAEYDGVRFAGIAAAGTDLPQFERAAQQPNQITAERLGSFYFRLGDNQILSGAGGKAMFSAEFKGVDRAICSALSAEQTPSEIYRQDGVFFSYCLYRAVIDTARTFGAAPVRMNNRPTAEPLRKDRIAFGV